MPQTFSLLSLFLPASMAWVIFFGYEYFYWKFFFPKFFTQHFFSKIFYSTFFFQNFLLNIFFPKFFFNFFFWALYSRCFLVCRANTDSMYLCCEKYDLQRAVEIGLSSRMMCEVLVFDSYCSHHTRRKKSNFFPLLHNILFIFFLHLRYFIEVLKFFSRWHLIAKCIKFFTRNTNTPIFLYDHSEASVKFVDFAY